ncbi:MAG TPA: LacI family DNA-binding transcriptional regulator [Tissierellales bacterium]|nr:LacI family DNA-binding transcriptional regulator [Tissierellales bacterium]
MTIKRIAEIAKVSTATVSKVINGKDQHISDATRQRVLEIVEREGYIPNGVAKSLKTRRTKTIGIIMPDVMNLFFSELTRGAEDAAEKKGYSVIICNSDNKETKEEKYLYILQEKMVDGIIMTASEGSIKKSMEKFNIPMVLVDRDIDINKKVGRITVDNEQGAYNATSYLIKKGCKNIGFISSDNKNKPSAERLKGYKNSLLDNGLKIEDEKIFLKRYTIDSGYMGAITLLKQSKIDGLCCGNDLIAIGAIKALKEKKIKVPEEVRVIGFDDIHISKYLDPSLTTMKQPIYNIGMEAVNMLISIINKEDISLTKVLKTELIERGSA